MDSVNNVKNTFSSWDNCMSKAYCKWPVIAGIIIGSLVLFSVLFCIGRCLCCGAECACCCFRCCAGCCGSGGGRRNKGHKNLDPVAPTPYGAQGGPGLPMYNTQYQSAPHPVYQNNGNIPQTATFDGKVHEDSLPAMPSWETATERRVEVTEDVKQPVESHEMEKLSPTGRSTSPTPLAGFAPPSQPAKAMAGGSAPHSPYAADERDPFLQGSQMNGVVHDGYRRASPNSAQAVGYGYANHRPGGPQNSQPSFNSYQDSRLDFYTQSGQGSSYEPQGPGAYDRPYGNQSRPAYDRQYSEQNGPGHDRQYNEQSRPTYDTQHGDQRQGYDRQLGEQRQGYNGQFNEATRQDGGYQQNSTSPPYDSHQPGYDSNQGMYRAFSPAYGGQQGRKAPNGSWKDV